MSRTTNIPLPPSDFAGAFEYSLRPREKRSFNTVLDAHKILAGSANPVSKVRYIEDKGDILLSMEHPMADGRMREEIRLVPNGQGGLVAGSLVREVFDAEGRTVRGEQVPDFRHDKLGLPPATYPEVALPFLLGWMPHDSERRSVYAWINDRFIAKVYVEVHGRTSLTAGGRSRDVVELMMYPDLNDWVPLGAVLTRLAKPFLPKYHMWYERKAPHRLVRFEGPYGPPGAPELVLELLG
ncbi:MAG: hypothetical protein ACLP1X_09770 [Polyangiaceae bacterium]|jgi:hypothetical protein